ncbi:hypothetical protein PV415_30165 [Streptomyces sp. ME03-5684b]|uniref:hypothetical protein n=1 Tax=Streptomyces sp. ME03-5684b TaxID=3028681 RepID=UPI0029AC04ED|nr:hypothetical protein [Streptomyces sp. ME03-5684b]MDX3321178.1 hypothetical protein [Streptomyces sp. ME03-5684b]
MILLPFVVALTLAGLGVYIASRNPALGAAILVGVGILGVIYVVLATDSAAFPTKAPASSTAPEPPDDARAEPPPAAPTTP